MTPLASHLIRRIASEGPITLADYMAECLMHPQHGYYSTRDPFGQKGDFTTAPEISQMFGEMIGLALAQCWLDQGRPARFVLAELGPGRGTLMADALRAARAVPGFTEAAELHLIETSAHLREIQKKTIAAPLTHHDSIGQLPPGPLFLIANEFFDALPIRQYQRIDTTWHERQVGLRQEALAIGLTAPVTVPELEARRDVADGGIVEICAPARAITAEIGARIAQSGGAALIIDYGGWQSLGDTLQALKGHGFDDPLAHPGDADLTAHVDFQALASAAAPASTTPMTTQGVFLERLGITARAQVLAQGLAEDALEAHILAHRRLTHPEEMGNLFKALAIYPPEGPAPPGF